MATQIQLIDSWKNILGEEFEKPYIQELRNFLRQEKDKKKVILPKTVDVFKAFNLTPYEKVKVVILGQDPYHGIGQAHGLCFSVLPGVPIPGSLRNIYLELKQDLGIPPARHGCLENWAKQGVLLLNTVLTVELGMPASHQGRGWEVLTDRVIKLLNEREDPVIFVLWGSHAQKKEQLIDQSRHVVLKAAHPSPLSAHRGFLGCKHFSKINEYLVKMGKTPIDWRLE